MSHSVVRKLFVTPFGKIRKVQASKLKSASDLEENSFKKYYTINTLNGNKDNFVWAEKIMIFDACKSKSESEESDCMWRIRFVIF